MHIPGSAKSRLSIATSVLFGFYHALNGVSNVIPAYTIGFALGYCALKTGSIWPGIALHAANNGLAGLTVIAGTGQISSSRLLACAELADSNSRSCAGAPDDGVSSSHARRPGRNRTPPSDCRLLQYGARHLSGSAMAILCLVCVVEISSRCTSRPLFIRPR